MEMAIQRHLSGHLQANLSLESQKKKHETPIIHSWKMLEVLCQISQYSQFLMEMLPLCWQRWEVCQFQNQNGWEVIEYLFFRILWVCLLDSKFCSQLQQNLIHFLGLNNTHIGPGPVQVNIYVNVSFEMQPIWNVIGVIEGVMEPDRAVIMGCHRGDNLFTWEILLVFQAISWIFPPPFQLLPSFK